MNGLVLAGGKSIRMQQDKAMLNYHGVPQYQYVFQLLQSVCQHVFVSNNQLSNDMVLPQLIDAENFKNLGPIAALHTAFQQQCTDWMVIAIDYPFVTLQDVKHLVQQQNKDADATVFYNANTNFYEPFLGIYNASFQQQLTVALHQNNSSMQSILQHCNVQQVIPINATTLININTFDEYLKFLPLFK
jgi:molybdenum cofactor guanylyltransferase